MGGLDSSGAGFRGCGDVRGSLAKPAALAVVTGLQDFVAPLLLATRERYLPKSSCTVATLSQVRMPHAITGERMHRCCRLDAEAVAQFASLCGDQNPIHSDAEHASRTRFGGIVVSGPHLSSLLMGMTASYFSKPGPNGPRAMLGLDFRFRFRRAVLAGQPIELSWEVVAVREKASLAGDLVFLAGRVRDVGGQDAVTAVGKVLVCERL